MYAALQLSMRHCRHQHTKPPLLSPSTNIPCFLLGCLALAAQLLPACSLLLMSCFCTFACWSLLVSAWVCLNRAVTTGVMLQGLIHRGMGPGDVQQGWDLALSSTHLAVTLPTRVAAVYEFKVRSFVSLFFC